MSILIIPKEKQAIGNFNNGAIVENKPIGFPSEGGQVKAYSNMFYWANAIALEDSTIGLHPHSGFEIMSIVLSGTIRHYDTKIKEWIELQEGDVQIIRSGKGISHAEHMTEGSRMFQIWFDPNLANTLHHEASYNDYRRAEFATESFTDFEKTYISGSRGIVNIESEVSIELWQGVFEHHESNKLDLSKDHYYSMYVLEGTFTIDGSEIKLDDFCIIKNANEAQIHGSGKILVIQNPIKLPYTTYAESIR